MTLKQAKQAKLMVIKASLDRKIDLTDFWLSICWIQDISFQCYPDHYELKYKGSIEDGHYIIEKISDFNFKAKGGCYMEISFIYENRRCKR